jgi:hypothetical protein
MIVKNTNCHRSDKYIITGKPLNFGTIVLGVFRRRVSTEDVDNSESDASKGYQTRMVGSRNLGASE